MLSPPKVAFASASRTAKAAGEAKERTGIISIDRDHLGDRFPRERGERWTRDRDSNRNRDIGGLGKAFRFTGVQSIEVACFFEQYAMYKAGKKVGIIVPKESASLPGIDPQSIQANHVNMCKFEDEDREGYKNISQRLNKWIQDLSRSETPAGASQGHSVSMSDVNYQEKIENNRGIVMGHAYSTATDGVRITGSTTTNTYHVVKPSNPNGTAD